MILDQIREVPLTLTHRYSCPGILEFKSLVGPSTKGILAKEQEAELDVVMIPLLKKKDSFLRKKGTLCDTNSLSKKMGLRSYS